MDDYLKKTRNVYSVFSAILYLTFALGQGYILPSNWSGVAVFAWTAVQMLSTIGMTIAVFVHMEGKNG